MDAVIFDLDGVLADTHALVVGAYSRVGVNMPSGAYGRPWTEWLIELCGGDLNAAENLHNQKVEVYKQMILTASPLPPLELYHDLMKKDVPVAVVTGASRKTSEILMKKFDIPTQHLIGAGCSFETKRHIVSQFQGHVVYIDDFIKPDHTWWPDHCKWVQYVDQTYDQIKQEVTDAWTQ